MAATVVQLCVAPGDAVGAGALLAIVEAMKMEHELRAPAPGRVVALRVAVGELVAEGDTLCELGPDAQAGTGHPPVADDPALMPDARLAQSLARHALTLDAARPQAMARRHALGLRSARENIADLCAPGSFVEYGALAYAAQEQRRPREELIRQTPADGIVTGVGEVDAGSAGEPARRRCAVLAYDATVLAGTQGFRSHQKTDRLLQIAAEQRLPLVLFAEGGGGRPGDSDLPIVAGLHVGTFAALGRLAGRAPTIGIAAGRCFAGNAALLGACDLVIATRASNIGMGGPAMVEGGGLGVFAPEAIGPSEVQQANGVIDVLVDDEAQAVAAARRCLGFWQGPSPDWHTDRDDGAALRTLLPAQRNRVYDMRALLQRLVDHDSLIELQPGYGATLITVLARLEGRPLALVASNPAHLGGAVDAEAAQKLARFWQLADAWGLPIVSLIDTPGFMVGPEEEARGHVRHASRLFVAGARLRVPKVALVVRRAFGLGAMALAGGGLHETLATAAWPSAEFGAMGLEGAVKLGYRKELEAQPEGAPRQALFERLLAEQVERGQAIRMAETLEIDAVIDPADSRRWIATVLAGASAARYDRSNSRETPP